MTDTKYRNGNEATVIGMEWGILTCMSEPILVHVMFGVGGPTATQRKTTSWPYADSVFCGGCVIRAGAGGCVCVCVCVWGGGGGECVRVDVHNNCINTILCSPPPPPT